MSQITKLTQEDANQLANALARLDELKNAPPELSIVKPDGQSAASTETLSREAEIAALVEHIAGKLLAHGGELIGCWFAIQNEYSPLLRAFAPLIQRLTLVRPLKPEVIDPNKN